MALTDEQSAPAHLTLLQAFGKRAPTQGNTPRGNNLKEPTMKYARAITIAALAGFSILTLATTSGCAVARNQETAGAYVDDTSITTQVKARYVEDKTVAATSISVETLNGVVQLSGFAKSSNEKAQAENIARNVKGVRSVRNDIIVRPG
jgi:osmotically-inducible protein OsmY